MKKLLIFVATYAALICTANAVTMTPYVSAGVGTSSINTDGTDWGSAVSIAGGLAFSAFHINMRGELEFSYLTVNGNSFYMSNTGTTSDSQHDVQTEKYLANFYIDMLQSYKLKPYVGIGVGYIHLTENKKYKQVDMIDGTIITNIQTDILDDAIVYGLHAGAAFELTYNLLGDIGAKFFEARLDHSDKHMFAFNFGLRYLF